MEGGCLNFCLFVQKTGSDSEGRWSSRCRCLRVPWVFSPLVGKGHPLRLGDPEGPEPDGGA